MATRRFAVSVLIQQGRALTHALYIWPAADADSAEAEISGALLSRGFELRGLLTKPV